MKIVRLTCKASDGSIMDIVEFDSGINNRMQKRTFLQFVRRTIKLSGTCSIDSYEGVSEQ